MGCGCSKYETEEPLVRESGPYDVSVYANMRSGTLAYFGPNPRELKHVGVVLNLSTLLPHTGPLLLEYTTGEEALHDTITGKVTDTGTRLIALDTRLRSLPSDWNVYYQYIIDSPALNEAECFNLAKALQDSPTLSNSVMLVTAFHARLGIFDNVTQEPAMSVLWRGRLLREPYKISSMIKPSTTDKN